ncbi:HAD-IA family hydrolase [uncultured Alteromonas sp.]|uniref:HAD-IA family hydrolase n=1 Tax=uncultured Alteromonas sp. TaxID=179113 RepID=UPI0025D2A444|nr:HAD-IA family hydrolase [uncultured Alteromonas sp.]
MQCYRPVSPVKAMTFDLDDTLYDNEPIIADATEALNQRIAERYPAAAAIPAAQWAAIKRELIKGNQGLASDTGQLRYETLYQGLAVEKLSDSERHQAAQSLFDYFYHARSDFTVTEEVKQVLAALAAKVPLIAITNGNVDTAQIGIDQYFTATYHASLKRPSKPHRHMFDEAAQALGLAPHEILHVGDNLEKDVLGAHRAGLQTAWIAVNRPMDLRQEDVSVLPGVHLHSLKELLWFVA